MKHVNKAAQRGNALWFILIAVVLLGTLTITLSRSGSSVDQSGDVEQNLVKASQIMRYAKGLEAGVQKLLAVGCSENELSFDFPSATGYNNTDSPGDESCHLFEPEGAGLGTASFSSAQLAVVGEESVIFNNMRVIGLGADSGAAGTDLAYVVETTAGICEQINRTLGLSTAVGQITSDINDWNSKFTGAFAAAGFEIGDSVDAAEAPGLNAAPAGCLIDASGAYVFYQVLIAR